MSSQKKSSTKVRAKNAAPTGQRQYSNLLRAQGPLMKAKANPGRKQVEVAYIATSSTQRSKGSPNHLMRTGMKSELLMTLDSISSGFHVRKRFRVNPLSRATFKWLPQIAQNFESYKFHTLRVRYENRCSSTTGGSIMISPSYDAADSAAQADTEQLLYENKDTVDFSVWKSGSLSVKSSSMNRLYKSHTCMSDDRFSVTKQDLKTIDPAQIFVCLDGVTPGAATGKIFLDYDVEFFEPHAATEPVNQGGSYMQFPLNNVTSNSAVPFVGLPTLSLQETVPILKDLATLVGNGTIPTPSVGSPTAILGQLSKDYDGYINIYNSGTGITTFPRVFRSTNATAAAGGPGDIELVNNMGSGVVSGSGTNSMIQKFLKDGQEGDYIKVLSGAFTSLNNFTSSFGASSI